MPRKRLCLAALAFACASPGTFAEPSQLPPIQVEADSFRVLVKENKAVWRGNVIATQGNFRFKASRLTIHLDQVANHDPDETGSAQASSSRPFFELSARELSYDLDTDQIVGAGDSELRRGTELIRADRESH